MKNQRGMRGAKRLFFVQISLSALFALLLCALFNARIGYAFFVGGIVWVIPQMFFARVLFQDQRARFAKNAMKRVYRAEVIKLTLSVLLFAGVFRWLHLVPQAFFMGYLMACGLNWLAPWCFKYENKKVGIGTS